MNAGPRSRDGLPTARRLARSLLAETPGEDAEQRVVAAFRRFLALNDDLSSTALDELRLELRTYHPESYFLELLQAEVNRAVRKRRGIYFTPGPVVEFLIRRVEQLVPEGPLRIVDPASGGGAFLLAALELAARRPGSQIMGFDVSSAAVEVTRLLLERTWKPDASARENLQMTLPLADASGYQGDCLNPLLAGDALAPQLLGDETLVILGNPPYANYGRLNRGPWIDGLLADYRVGIVERKLNLTDDFIKFLRWGQYWIDRAGRGVLAMITSRTYLSGVTHRGMRRSLAESFPAIEIVDLHGDTEPDDENIFAIRRGVAIGVFSKGAQASRHSPKHQYSSLLGSRDDKLHALSNDLPSQTLTPQSPEHLFVPASLPDATANEYLSWPRLDEIFTEFISGVQTKNDALLVDFDREDLAARMREHLGERFDPALVQPYVVGPFDRRWLYYDRELVGRPRWPAMRHLIKPGNLALVFMRQSTNSGEYDHALVVDCLASDRVFYSRRGAPFVAPLWQRAEGKGQRAEGKANFVDAWVTQIAERLGSRTEGESLFAYLYAVLHCPSYRQRHRTELMRDFPRIPWPRSREQFERLAWIGGELIAFHLRPRELKSKQCEAVVVRGFPKYEGDGLQLNRECSLPLDAAAWSFHVGGHRVIERWLQVRRGRTLSAADFQHLAWLEHVALETGRLVDQLSDLS